MRSSNPMLRDNVFNRQQAMANDAAMTIQGTVNKSFFLLFLTVFASAWVWMNPTMYAWLVMPAAIAGLIIAIAMAFKPQWGQVLAPTYALAEGIVIGLVSVMVEKMYPGLVIKAVVFTFGTLFCLLAIYKSGLIKVNDKFRLGIFAATGAIMLVYLINLIMGFFGHSLGFINGGGALGIGFSFLVVGIAAMNLVLDFDFIDRASSSGAPKYMEWYGAFALMVTLIWLYFEILRLLMKLARRD